MGSDSQIKSRKKYAKMLHFASFPLIFAICWYGLRDPQKMLLGLAAFGLIHGFRHIVFRGAIFGARSSSESEFFEIEAGGANVAYGLSALYAAADVDGDGVSVAEAKTVLVGTIAYFIIAFITCIAWGRKGPPTWGMLGLVINFSLVFMKYL